MRCPVCLAPLGEILGRDLYYKCTQCGKKIPRTAALSTGTPIDPGIIIYPSEAGPALMLVGCLATGVAVFSVTPTMPGDEFIWNYIMGAIVAWPVCHGFGRRLGNPNGGLAALAMIETAGLTRIFVGFYYGMHKFGYTIVVMMISILVAVLFSSRRGNFSGDGSGCGSWYSGSSCGSSCGGGCGGGCGGCGGS